ncbi:MAG: zinc-ribbon domain-containing protein [Spirochaetales bacterium]|nr:zinc-ribbon domain-containing protein [Spirochaetales bacterium]
MLSKEKLKTHSLAARNPELAKQWHPTKNGSLTPSDVAYHSARYVWWLCENGHAWRTQMNHRAKGCGCPYCINKFVCEDNSLKTVKPSLADEWHPRKNGILTPENVTYRSSLSVWWQCTFGHEWKARILYRSVGGKCPYCSGTYLCKESSLASVYPDLAAEWHPTKNGDLTPFDFLPSSNKKVWWRCKKGHAWKAGIAYRKYRGCPYCAGKRVSPENCFGTTYPDYAAEWHPSKNGTLTAKEVTVNSHKKVWWRCANSHEWQSTIVYRSKGYGCPYCDGRIHRKKSK